MSGHRKWSEVRRQRYPIYPRNLLSPPWDIDAPWFYVLQAEAWAEELSQAAWIEELKQRWHLVTRKEGK